MVERKSRIIKKLLIIPMLIIGIVFSFSILAAAENTYISELRIATGEFGEDELQSKGYQVLFQGLNVVSDGDSAIRLGYKKGAEAITDILVSAKKADTIQVDSIEYTLVSLTNLNVGTEGKEIYLYYTKDARAGKGIVSLDTVSGLSGEEVIALKNDGSSPVRTDEKKLADFDDGIEGSELYLLMTREQEMRPYISAACLIRGDTKADAIKAAADSGCDFYLDYDLRGNDGCAYIAYQRTADKTAALTSVTLADDRLTADKDGNSETYLLDITYGRMFGSDFTLGEWISFYAASSPSVSKTADGYGTLSKSGDACSNVPINEQGSIYAIYLGNKEGAAEIAVSTTSADVSEESTEIVTDEYIVIDKADEETQADDETADEAGKDVASAFGSGNIKMIVILAVIIIFVIAGILIFKKVRGNKNEKQDS